MKINLGRKKEIKKKCGKCGKFVTYVPKYKRYYCTNCELYTDIETEETATLKTKTEHENIPPPPLEEGQTFETTLEETETPGQEEANQAAALQRQKQADMNYFKQLYGNVMLTKEENTRLFYGILSETKTLNFQIAQLIEMIRHSLLIKK